MVEQKKSIKSNYFYSLLQQAVTVTLPLVTVPYLSRVLGPEGIGIVAFTGSIIQYFILFGGLGLALYGNRAVARVRNNLEERSKTFWEIFTLRATLTLAAFLFLTFFLILLRPLHSKVFFVQSILILNASLDISWLYMALEDFKKIAIRNMIIRLLGLVLVFLLIKRNEDFIKYAFIIVLTDLIGQAIYWVKIKDLVQKPCWSRLKWKRHIPSTIGLFVPELAVQVYVVLDKTMLGLLVNISEVALYSQPEKIIKALLRLITTSGTVMLPRMSYLFSNSQEFEFFKYARKSLLFVSYGTFFFASLTFSLSNLFIPLFLGSSFLPSIKVFQALSPLFVFIGISNVLGIQLLIPMGKENLLSVSVIAGATTNFLGNLLLIPRYGAFGAAISSLCAELLVTAIQWNFLRSSEFFKGAYWELGRFFVAASACIVTSLIIRLPQSPSWILIILCSFAQMIIYIVVLRLLHSETQTTLLSLFLRKRHIL